MQVTSFQDMPNDQDYLHEGICLSLGMWQADSITRWSRRITAQGRMWIGRRTNQNDGFEPKRSQTRTVRDAKIDWENFEGTFSLFGSSFFLGFFAHLLCFRCCLRCCLLSFTLTGPSLTYCLRSHLIHTYRSTPFVCHLSLFIPTPVPISMPDIFSFIGTLHLDQLGTCLI